MLASVVLPEREKHREDRRIVEYDPELFEVGLRGICSGGHVEAEAVTSQLIVGNGVERLFDEDHGSIGRPVRAHPELLGITNEGLNVRLVTYLTEAPLVDDAAVNAKAR